MNHVSKISTLLLLCLALSHCSQVQDPGQMSPSTPAQGPSGDIWIPAPNTTFQWQLTGLPLDTQVDAQVFDIDLFENDKSAIDALHASGKRVICYLSVGSWEDFRPDQGDFPKEILGKEYAGFPDEKWLDIRRLDLLGPLLEKRFDLAKSKGCDAIEPDNIDGYQNDTGFPLSYADQLTFNRWIADRTHERGMSVGLKNDPDQVADLLASFDWALTEDCHVDGWCDQMDPFIAQGKAVFQVEYSDTGVSLNEFCPKAKENQFFAILKNRDLDAFREACP